MIETVDSNKDSVQGNDITEVYLVLLISLWKVDENIPDYNPTPVRSACEYSKI